MVRKKLDNRIRVLIENSVALHHRSLFIVVGEKGRDCIPLLHEMLSKAEVRARPSVLWCYKKDLGFSTNKKKQKRLKKAQSAMGKQYLDENDSIEYFIASTNIRYCYYSETNSIMGQTFGMAILQDFEAIRPNLLARTIETVEGGGMILILLQSIASIKQLYTMAMDVHLRYRTEAHQHVVCRFNERFILSLTKCSNCLFLDDKLNILPVHSKAYDIKPIPPKSWDAPKSVEEEKLVALKASLDGSQPMHVLVKKCKTYDQAMAVMKFIDSLSEKTLRSTVTLTAARGRGKSAALGLAVAAAIAYTYPNIAVTSPHPENLKTFFKFLLEGLDALGYEKATDYEEIRSAVPEFNKAIIQVNVSRKLRQTVRYIQPGSAKLGNVELLVIDEAAAIPLPMVKALLGPYLVFMASTVNGYEGTGRSLSLKLIDQLRKQSASATDATHNKSRRSVTGRILNELTLSESIRYKKGDKVEDWLNRLLCLNATIPPSTRSFPPSLDECKLCYVNRDTLFSYHKDAERFLQNLIAILVASHYKNTPDDLQIMSDAPAHHVFCLCVPPKQTDSTSKRSPLPEILCVVQVCLEGKISKQSVQSKLNSGGLRAGDLIPWTISQEFNQESFPSLSGVRIVRIATHPDYQGRGYGLRAVQLVQDFYEGKFYLNDEPSVEMTSTTYDDTELMEEELKETLETRTSLPTLFPPLNSLRPEILDYMGVSYGVSDELLRFWKRAKFCPVYLGSSPNQLTGEYSCIMLKQLVGTSTSSKWLSSFTVDFCSKIVRSIGYFKLDTDLVLNLISNECILIEDNLSPGEMKLVEELYEDCITDLKIFCSDSNRVPLLPSTVSALTTLYFTHRIKGVQLTKNEKKVLFTHGILQKTLEAIAADMNISHEQVSSEFRNGFTKVATCALNICGS